MLKTFRISGIIILMSFLLIVPIACKSTPIPTPGVSAEWFGNSGGVSEYNGTNWTTYNTSNSGLASDYVFAIAIDSTGNK